MTSSNNGDNVDKFAGISPEKAFELKSRKRSLGGKDTGKTPEKELLATLKMSRDVKFDRERREREPVKELDCKKSS